MKKITNKILIIFAILNCNFSLAIIFNDSMGDVKTTFNSDKEFPYVGLNVIYYGENAISSCSATLINPRTVISAAHCIPETSTNGTTYNSVFMLGNDLRDASQPLYGNLATLRPDKAVTAGSNIFNEKYFENGGRGGSAYDLTIMSLDTPIYLDSFPSLPNSTPKVGDKVAIVGYGIIGYGSSGYDYDNPADENLADYKRRSAENKISGVFIDTGESINSLSIKFDKEDSSDFLPKEGFVGRGDSGGPIFLIDESNSTIEYVLLGATCCGNTPGSNHGIYDSNAFFSSYYDLLDWINTNLPLQVVSSSGDGSYSLNQLGFNKLPFSMSASGSSNSSCSGYECYSSFHKTSKKYYNANISDTVTLDSISIADNVFLSSNGKLILNNNLTLSGNLNSNSSELVINFGSSSTTGLSTIGDGTISNLTGEVILNNQSVLSGIGQINTKELKLNSSKINPGNSIGTLKINGNTTFDENSELIVEHNPLGSSDLLIVDGQISLSGTLTIKPLQDGSNFFKKGLKVDFLQSSNIIGTFNNLIFNDTNRIAGYLAAELSTDKKSFTYSNPNYLTLADGPANIEVAKQLNNITSIESSNLSLKNNIQSLLDEINLSKNLNNLNNGLSYFAPNLNHSIGAELTNFIFLKNNLEKVNTGSFSSNISYKNINQSNMNEANSKSMFLSFGINPFLLGINVDQTDSSGLVEFESDNISFFGKYFFGKFNDFSINLIHTNADIEEIRSRTFQNITTSGLNNIYLVNNYDLSLTSFTFDYSRKSNLREDEDNGWTYKSVFSFSVNNLDAPGFSENNHPNGLDITYESIDNIFLGIGFSAYSYKENIFNSPNLFFTSSLNLNFTNSLGSRNSYIDKNLGSFQINIEDSFQDLFQVAAELIYRADRVDYGFGINLSNTLSNFSIGVKVNLQ